MTFAKQHLSERAAKKIVKQAIAAAKLPETTVRVEASIVGNTRFANNGITTTGDVETVSVRVTSSVEGRSASVTGTRTDKAGLAALVGQAEELAKVSPVDPEHMPPLGPQKYEKSERRDSTTATVGAPQRAATVEKVAQLAGDRGLIAAGFLSHHDRIVAMGNAAGLFAFAPDTSLDLSTTFRTPDGTGSGYKAFTSHRAQDLDPETLATVAADKAEMSKSPGALGAGRYTLVLEAQAVADLLGFLVDALSTREAEEGRSYFSAAGGKSRLGEKLFDDRVTLFSDPGHVDHPAAPFARDGLPQRQQVWVESGKLRQLSMSRFWAKRTGRDPIARPSSLHMQGEGKSMVDLIAAAGDGVLVTRFHYNRMLEARHLLVTGLTRDGTFAIKGGKLDGAINNFRYNESPLTLLSRVVAMGTPERVASGQRVMVVPPLVVEGFNLASVSQAV